MNLREIRAALEAAIDASFLHDGEDRQPPVHYRNVRRWRVAHELAAFLRGLDVETRHSLATASKSVDELAAAVEAAAKEPSHD